MPSVRGNSSAPSVDSDNEPPAPKRRRTSIACNLCRSRKSRCSGDQPCSLCAHLNVPCQYYSPTTQYDSVVLPNSSFTDVQERLEAIEKLLQVARDRRLVPSNQDALTPNSEAQGAQGTISERSLRQPHVESASPGRSQPSTSDLGKQDFSQPIIGISNEPDVNNAIDGIAITVAEGEQSAFFGPSSNTAFLRQIQALTTNTRVPSISEGVKHGTITATSPGISFRRSESQLIERTNELVLPQDEVLESLIDQYFNNAALTFPYIHEPSFRAKYAALKAARFKSMPRAWLGLLNMILATASKITNSSKQNSMQHDTDDAKYYRRATKICGDHMFFGTSVEMVQCLLLMAWYLQSTQDSARTWFVHSLAVRTAISLGFHSELATKNLSAIDKETRVRAWYGCVTLDRALGICFGRPWMIASTVNRLRRPAPFPFPHANYGSESKVAQVDRLGVLFLTEINNLNDIIVDIISIFYGDNLGFSQLETSQKILPHVISFVARLETWWDAVDPSIRWRPSRAPNKTMAEPLKDILKLNFLNTQLLLYRPIILLASQSRPSMEEEEHSLIPQIIPTCIRKCLRCTTLTISIVQDLHYGGPPSVNGLAWRSLYQTFHAALSAFAILLLTPHLLPDPVSQNLFILENAVSVLSGLGQENKMAQACSQYIQQLLTTLRNPSEAVQTLPQTPTRFKFAQQQANQAESSDINLAQFFSQDQIDLFNFGSMEKEWSADERFTGDLPWLAD